VYCADVPLRNYSLTAVRPPRRYDPLCDNMKKTEVHNVLRCSQRSVEPRPQLTRTETFVEFGRVVYEIREQTEDRQTHRHAHRKTSHPYRGPSIDSMSTSRPGLMAGWATVCGRCRMYPATQVNPTSRAVEMRIIKSYKK